MAKDTKQARDKLVQIRMTADEVALADKLRTAHAAKGNFLTRPDLFRLMLQEHAAKMLPPADRGA